MIKMIKMWFKEEWVKNEDIDYHYFCKVKYLLECDIYKSFTLIR